MLSVLADGLQRCDTVHEKSILVLSKAPIFILEALSPEELN